MTLDELTDGLRRAFPPASVDVDPPLWEGGAHHVDIIVSGHPSTIAWRAGVAVAGDVLDAALDGAPAGSAEPTFATVADAVAYIWSRLHTVAVANDGSGALTLTCENGEAVTLKTGESAVLSVGDDGKFEHVIEHVIERPGTPAPAQDAVVDEE